MVVDTLSIGKIQNKNQFPDFEVIILLNRLEVEFKPGNAPIGWAVRLESRETVLMLLHEKVGSPHLLIRSCCSCPIHYVHSEHFNWLSLAGHSSNTYVSEYIVYTFIYIVPLR